MAPTALPPARFAVIADIHYASQPVRNGWSNLDKVKDWVKEMNAADLAFTIQLGDIIQAYPGDPDKLELAASDYRAAMTEYDRLAMPHYSVVGNHEWRNGAPEMVREIEKHGRLYYDFTSRSAPGWRFVVLDFPWEKAGAEPLAWFDRTLTTAGDRGEKVIVFFHGPPFAGQKDIIREHPILDSINRHTCVAAVFDGHAHSRGYREWKGVHHIILQWAPAARRGLYYVIVELHPDRITLGGNGAVPPAELPLKSAAKITSETER